MHEHLMCFFQHIIDLTVFQSQEITAAENEICNWFKIRFIRSLKNGTSTSNLRPVQYGKNPEAKFLTLMGHKYLLRIFLHAIPSYLY
jgi:hypothetical protein